jgi:hypothetical protein
MSAKSFFYEPQSTGQLETNLKCSVLQEALYQNALLQLGFRILSLYRVVQKIIDDEPCFLPFRTDSESKIH